MVICNHLPSMVYVLLPNHLLTRDHWEQHTKVYDSKLVHSRREKLFHIIQPILLVIKSQINYDSVRRRWKVSDNLLTNPALNYFCINADANADFEARANSCYKNQI
jgi:hypothetical protein